MADENPRDSSSQKPSSPPLTGVHPLQTILPGDPNNLILLPFHLTLINSPHTSQIEVLSPELQHQLALISSILTKSGVGLQISSPAPLSASTVLLSLVVPSSSSLPATFSVSPPSTVLPNPPIPSQSASPTPSKSGKSPKDLLMSETEQEPSDSHQEGPKEKEGQKHEAIADVQVVDKDVQHKDVQLEDVQVEDVQHEDVLPEDVLEKDVMDEDVAEDSSPDVEELSDSSITASARKGKAKAQDLHRRVERSKSTRPLPPRQNVPTRSQIKRKAANSPSPIGKSKKTKNVPPSASLSDSEGMGSDSISDTTEIDPKNCYSHKFFTDAAESIYETMSVKTIRPEKNIDWQSFQKYMMGIFLQERGLWNSLTKYRGFVTEII